MYTPHNYHGYVPQHILEPFIQFFEKHEPIIGLFFFCMGCFAFICLAVLFRVKVIDKYRKMKTLFNLWLQAQTKLDSWDYEHPGQLNSSEGQSLVFYELSLLRQILIYRDLTEDESAREQWLASVAQPDFVPETHEEQYGS